MIKKTPLTLSTSINDVEEGETESLKQQSKDEKPVRTIEIIEDDEDKESEYKARMLLISFISMVVASMGNRVFQKLQTVPMFVYSFFLFCFCVCVLLCY